MTSYGLSDIVDSYLNSTFDLLVLKHVNCLSLLYRLQCLLKSESLFHCQSCNLILIDER